MGLFARLTATRRHTRRLARPTHRRARLEPLEQRRLLSVSPAADHGPDEYALGVGDDNVGNIQSAWQSPSDAGYDTALAASQEGPDLVLPPWALIELPDGRNLSEIVTMNLARLHYEYEAFIAAGGEPDDFVPSDPDLRVVGDRVPVDILADEPVTWEEVDQFGDVVEMVNQAFIDELEAIGLEVIALGRITLGAFVPFDAIDELAALNGVGTVYATTPVTHGDDTEPQVSQGPQLLLPPWMSPGATGSLPASAEEEDTVGQASSRVQPTMVLVGGGPMTVIDDTSVPRADPDPTIDELAREAMGENKDGPMAKMGWDLTYLHFEYEAFVERGGDPSEFTPSNGLLRFEDGRVAVEVSTIEPLTYDRVDEWGDLERLTNAELIGELEAAGLEVSGASGHLTGGWLRADAIDDLAALGVVRSVWPAYGGTVGSGTLIEDATPPQTGGDEAQGIYIVPGDSYYDYRSDPLAEILGGPLAEAYREYEAFIAQGGDPTDFTPSNPLLRVNSGKISVDIVAIERIVWQETIDGEILEFRNTAFLEQLDAIGLEIAGMSAYTVGGWLPIAALDELAQVPGIRFVAPPSPGVTHNEGPDDQSIRLVRTDAYDYRSDPLADKLGGPLARAYWEYEQMIVGGGQPADFTPSNPLVKVNSGRISVDIVAIERIVWQETIDGETVQYSNTAFLERLEAIGLQIAGMSAYTVGGWLPIEAMGDLADVRGIRFVAPPSPAVTFAGSVTTQGDIAQLSSDLRDQEGLDGAGITVGVLSDSFDRDESALTDGADDAESGDLPALPRQPNDPWEADVDVLDDSYSNGADEGRAMLQIVHDVAPGAELAFHTAFFDASPQVLFAAAMRELADSGADVIVDDVIYFAEPMFMDGLVAQAVNDVVAQNVAYFSAAGNQASQSYESAFRDSGYVLYIDDVPVGVLHDFDPGAGVDVSQTFTLGSQDQILLSFQWDEPFASVTGGVGSANNMDVYIIDSQSNLVWDDNSDNMDGDPVELVQFTNTSGSPAQYQILMVWEDGQSAPGLMKYVNFGDGTNFEYATNSPTLFGHANAAGAIAVGAAFYYKTPEFGTSPPEPESFTALGGTDILFDTEGNRLQTPEDRMKPDVVGPDVGNTTFFGADIPLPPGAPDRYLCGDTDSDNYPNFFGTSAAAPHVAGLAALMLEAAPAATPAGIASALESTAVDMEGAGFDYLTGYGLVDAVEATEYLMERFPDFDANDDPAPGDQKDDGTADYLYASRIGDNLKIQIHTSLLPLIPIASIDGFSFTCSTDQDTFHVHTLGDFTGNVVMNGADEADHVVIWDTTGDDVVTIDANSNSAEFKMENAYTVRARGAGQIVAWNLEGGADVAYLYDTAGDDELIAPFDHVTLESDGGGFYQANRFRWVHVYSVNGGYDTAYLYDSAGNDDFFAYWSHSARLRDNAGTFNNRAVGFDEVYAYAGNGGTDRAYLYDDASGDDTFTAYPTWAQREGTGFLNYAESFEQVYAIPYQGQHGGTDNAYLYDDPAGDDTFYASPTLAKLYGDGFYNQASSFAQVLAYSGVDHGFDVASLYDDPAGDDTFYAAPTLGKLYGDGFFNQAKSFAQVHAYSGVGHGFDVASLYDDAAGNDTFYAWPTEAKLYGDGFYNRAKSFAQVHAYSGVDHGNDIAGLYDDPAGNDTFRAWPTEAKLYGNGFYNRAKSFAQVHAYSGVDHGQDVAQLYDDDSGNDTFKAWPTEAKLYGNGFYNRAKSFRTVYGYAEQGSGGTDVGYLYDSTGDDYLQARDGDPSGEDWVMLRDEAVAEYTIWAYGLDEIWADSGTDDDTADVGDNLDFDLHLTGAWEN
ncbi:MAG TPA: S8 family serine peptidase [Thermoguttaceae bacterium]|nr:S8 family serine peptidase [Thermoguttaceae bacterium]